ncbi:DNA translocase FtsK 4TM domain-containing protein [Pseudidiomarina sp. 1APP75-32.1]|uniref:DNA translocase FtsK n=1 Tax=Pseudidiomarina terrestris TaxID=2820060 RepID=A0AAW7QY14_9GAMM|nr:DNA translocase FtsK 4TM domain-containing protein [Pseudidiomarina sp. 1APP75-32.1]MDN7128538.1 DNA translocase FtsK 4TM domain-containing protein [Pseudidiomarina sp. 1APR75-15]
MSGAQRVLEVGLILCGAFAIFLFLALVSFNPADPSWSQTGYQGTIENAAGAIGAWFADALLFSFGFVAYLIPFGLAGLGYVMFRQPHRLVELDYLALGLRLIGLILTLVGAAALASLNFSELYSFSAGGVVGDVISSSLLPYFNLIGTTLLLLTFLCTGLTLVTGISWVWLADKLGELSIRGTLWLVERSKTLLERFRTSSNSEPRERKKKRRKVKPLPTVDEEEADALFERREPELDLDITLTSDDDDEPDLGLFGAAEKKSMKIARSDEKPAAQVNAEERQQVEEEHEAEDDAPVADMIDPLPSIALLDKPAKTGNPLTPAELEQISQTVEAVLQDFGVEVKVANVQPGPVITRFELDLAPGVKVSKISNLDKDIARSLSAISVRVVEVIPGKSYVGLELPNKSRETVFFSDVISCDAFQQNPSPLTMVLGKGIAGQPVVVDLAKMPHLLVAGTTGSGKSVGVNVMILSLLYKSTPEQVRLIMIDPKMLELSVYEGIPHLLTEVVTDMKDAANALRWCVGEMERRYKLMSALGVRNLKGYNVKVEDAAAAGEPLRDPLWKPGDSMDEMPPVLETLPSIVVVIDEFADMMMIVGKKVEELIARIAQKARAAGIHLILATQRPSVDVITGLIKANIPTRIAFQVQSKIDSRTILDQPGADQLLGQGDMLYLPPGSGVPTRVHGAFIDDHEVHAVVADWKRRGKPNYLEEILSGDQSDDALLPGESAGDDDGESDPLYDEAVAFVTETQRVSVSSVQRKFRIGYNRAARIVEQMEVSGVVSSAASNGQRDVLAPRPPRD